MSLNKFPAAAMKITDKTITWNAVSPIDVTDPVMVNIDLMTIYRTRYKVRAIITRFGIRNNLMICDA
jgi:hypothetical protein